MGPKVEAAMRFVESGGRKTIITSLDRVKDALEGRAGTSIVLQ
jgi:carbamate kinase